MSGRAEMDAIPVAVRREVDERDQLFCRRCGRYLGDRRAHHHIRYGGDAIGIGGRRLHVLGNIVTLCWLPGDPMRRMRPCHDVVHADKLLWQPLLLKVIEMPGVTALQLRRWSR